jgi:hypothetical protein
MCLALVDQLVDAHRKTNNFVDVVGWQQTILRDA